MSQSDQSRQIAALNDAFRTTLNGGTLILTSGIQGLPEETQIGILYAVRYFTAFTPDNDPHSEHDFGSFTHHGQRIIWKIDYYDQDFVFYSENPTSLEATQRVLTIMLACEY